MKHIKILPILVICLLVGYNPSYTEEKPSHHGVEDRSSVKIQNRYFSKLNITSRGWSHKYSKIKANKMLKMTIITPDSVNLLINFKSKSGSKPDGDYFNYTNRKKNGKLYYSVKMFFPSEGDYNLILFAKSRYAGGSYPYLCSYTITATESSTKTEIIESGEAGLPLQASGSFSTLGISLSSFNYKKDTIVTNKSVVVIKFKSRKRFSVTAGLSQKINGKDNKMELFRVNSGNKSHHIAVGFPKKGKYSLSIYTFVSGKYHFITRYTIYAQSNTLSTNKSYRQILSPKVFMSKKKQADSPLNDSIKSYIVSLGNNKVVHAHHKDSRILSGSFCGLNSNGNPSPVLKFSENGQIYLAWTDSQLNSYVSELNSTFQIVKKSLVKLSRQIVYDMVATKDGLAILYVPAKVEAKGNYSEKPILYLAKYDYSGRKQFKTLVTGVFRDHKSWRVNDQGWNRSGLANLSWTGKLYAVYANTNRKWDDNVIHQADLLQYYDKSGRKVKGGYTWGNSHSFRPYSVYNGKYLVTATTGDAYPRALNISIINPRKLEDYKAHHHQIKLIKASGKTGDNDSHSSSGGLVRDGKNVLFAYDSKENRSSYDMGFFRVNLKTGKYRQFWLTNTRGIQERIPKMALYNEQYFVMWGEVRGDTRSGTWLNHSSTKLMAKVVDKNGKTVMKSEKLLYNFRGSTKLFNYPNGDIGWVNDLYSLNQLEIVRLSVK